MQILKDSCFDNKRENSCNKVFATLNTNNFTQTQSVFMPAKYVHTTTRNTRNGSLTENVEDGTKMHTTGTTYLPVDHFIGGLVIEGIVESKALVLQELGEVHLQLGFMHDHVLLVGHRQNVRLRSIKFCHLVGQKGQAFKMSL